VRGPLLEGYLSMTSVVAQPALIASAAANVASINSSVSQAAYAAAGSTTGIAAAAEDEVSAVITELFGAFGREGQELMARAGTFNEQLARLLSGTANAYTQAEAEAAGTLTSVGAPVQQLFSPLIGPAEPPPVFGPIVTRSGIVDSILYMSGSGTATPEVAGEIPPFIPNVTRLFLPDFMLSNKYAAPLQHIAVSTASGLYPFTGTKDLVFNTSLTRGVTELTNAINLVISPGTGNVAVLGYSQSAVVASTAMPVLHAAGFGPSQIQFNLLGDPANPNGGLLARFPGLNLPSLGITLGAATPSNLFPTNVYTLEYDGFADFPRYPINVLADVNALAGILLVHPTYQFQPSLTDGYLLQGSADLGNTNSMTNYYVIPTHNLPLLAPLRLIPYLGDAFADLVQPDLRALINWGYGDPHYGFSTSSADVPTPFGFLPPLSATTALGPLLVNGTQVGFSDFVSDLQRPPTFSLSRLVDPLNSITAPPLPALPTSVPSALTSFISGVTAANHAIVDTLTTDVAAGYSALLPTADIATALVVSVPSYDLDLFANGITQAINGQPFEGLVHAFGDPIAATTGATVLLVGFEGISVLNSLDTIVTGKPHPIPH
jgi:hypothetical protein